MRAGGEGGMCPLSLVATPLLHGMKLTSTSVYLYVVYSVFFLISFSIKAPPPQKKIIELNLNYINPVADPEGGTTGALPL